MRHQCLAVCAPGIEHILLAEVAALGVRRAGTVRGGVTFDASTRQVYAVNVWSRTATRLLVRVARFRAGDFASLEREAAAIAWERWIDARRPVRFRVSSTASRLYHTAAIEERLRRVIGAPPDPGAQRHDDQRNDHATDEHQLVVVRVDRDQFLISVDSSGEPLFKRGWRQRSTKAPLRETLAAAMLLSAEWEAAMPLVDPFCGSGTIAVEAALLAIGRAPGSRRSFAFQRWATFEPGTWASVQADVERSEREAPQAIVIHAGDRDAGAIDVANENATRAGVGQLITIERATISDLVAPASADARGWMITNPPYGRRVSAGKDLRDLFATLGTVARAELPGWNVGVLATDRRAIGHARLDWIDRFRTDNGGIPVRYVTASVGMAS